MRHPGELSMATAETACDLEAAEQRHAFANLMDMARAIAAQNPAGLREYLRALLLPLQAEHMLLAAQRDKHGAPAQIEDRTFFFDILKVSSYCDRYVALAQPMRISLARDIVLPTPWVREGYAAALACIGEGRVKGEWKQDHLNHALKVWMPWRIAFVAGGNHSITSGILSGQGELEVTHVYDFSHLFETVECDAVWYHNTVTKQRIAKVHDIRRAAAFEVGRLIAAAGRTSR